MLKIAITKGRIEKDFCNMLQKSGYNVEPLISKDRKLIIDTEDKLKHKICYTHAFLERGLNNKIQCAFMLIYHSS